MYLKHPHMNVHVYIYIYTYIYIPGITYNLYLNSVYSFTIDQGQRDQEPLDASTDAAG